MTDAQSAPVIAAAEKLCRICKKAMPAEGLKCTECGSFQNWRRIFSFSIEILALLIAFFSVLGIVVPGLTKWLNRHSDTQVRIVGASEGNLLVIVMNTGREPSTVHKFRASFVNVPLSDADLFPIDASEFHVPAEDSRMVRLRPWRFTPKPGNGVDAVRATLGGGTLKLFADIKESTNERPTDVSQRFAQYPTANISAWIETYIPGIE